jgi:hypothetical protein
MTILVRVYDFSSLIMLKALFGTRVFVEISEDNPLEYWMKPLSSPNPHKTPTNNPLGRERVCGIKKNTIKFGGNGITGD